MKVVTVVAVINIMECRRFPAGYKRDFVVIEAANTLSHRRPSVSPRDFTFGLKAGPRLPLPDGKVVGRRRDFVVVEAAGTDTLREGSI